MMVSLLLLLLSTTNTKQQQQQQQQLPNELKCSLGLLETRFSNGLGYDNLCPLRSGNRWTEGFELKLDVADLLMADILSNIDGPLIHNPAGVPK
jgi:hypothetical protein